MANGQSFNDMLGYNPQQELGMTPPGHQAMQQPEQIMAQVQRPAQSPAELEQRKAGWTELYQRMTSNPNIMRAIGMAGAALAQPLPAGQTRAGHLGQAFAVGQTAFAGGEATEFERQQARQKEQRATAESEANIAGTRAGTARTLQQTETERLTQESIVQTAKTAAEKASFDLSKARSVEELDKIDRELKAQRQEIERSIPEGTKRAAILAELAKPEAQLAELKAKTSRESAAAAQAQATARETGVDTDIKSVQLNLLKGMPPEEQKQFLSKTGKFAASTSGITQQASMWGEIYDKLPATDPAKSGKTREQFQMFFLQSAKAKDASDMYKNYILAGGEDPDTIKMLEDLIKGTLEVRGGAAPKPAAGAGPTEMVWDAKKGKYVPKGK
jgi:hypothetical protein